MRTSIYFIYISAMLKPFQTIVDSPRYHLRYANWYNSVNITQVIKDTHVQYMDNISDQDFNNLITALTNGGMTSSPISMRKDPTIIMALCEYFPKQITKKHIDKLIRTMEKRSYPKTCINALSEIIGTFTKSQLKHLISAGYDMMSGMDSMSYDEFTAQFDNMEYMHELRQAIMTNHNDTPHVLDEKIKKMNDMRLMYNIQFDTKFIDTLLVKYNSGFQITLTALLNVHIIAKNMGVLFDNNQLKNILKTYTICDFVPNNREYYCDDNSKCMLLKCICDYYPCTTNEITIIDREFILDLCDKIRIIKILINPLLTNYNPLEDLFYILTETGADACEFLQHLLKLNYLNYDDFLLYLLSLGYDDTNATILREYINQKNNFHDNYLSFFYMFSNTGTFEILFDNKMIPTSENILQCTKREQLLYIQNTDIYMNENSIEYIGKIMDVNQVESTQQFDLIPEHFLEIYNSLDKKSREIIARIPISRILKFGTIIRYDIKLTKQYLVHLITYGHWRNIVKLLCLTNKYDYLYDLFDIDMIMYIPSVIARMWFLNNIYNSSSKLYILSVPSNYHSLTKTPCNVFDLKLNLDIDVSILLKENIINNIKIIQDQINDNKQKIRKLYIAKS